MNVMPRQKVHNWSNNPLKNKFIVIPTALLIGLSTLSVGTKYAPQIKQAVSHAPVFGQKSQTLMTFPDEAVVASVVDGDTVYLHNGQKLRYMGINCPEKGQPYYQKALDQNKKLVEGKKIKLEYDGYRFDKYDRILAYPIISGKNISIELVRQGLCLFANYDGRKPLIYQDQLIKVQGEAKEKKLGIWK